MVLLKVHFFQKINVTSNLKSLSYIKDLYPYYLNSKQSALNLKLNIYFQSV